MIKTLYENDWDADRVFKEEPDVQGGDFLFSNKIPQFIDQSDEKLDDIQSGIQKVLSDFGYNIKFREKIKPGAYGMTYGAQVGRTTKQWVIKSVILTNETTAKGFQREVFIQSQLAEYDAAPKVYGSWIISGKHRVDYNHQAYGIVVMERMSMMVQDWGDQNLEALRKSKNAEERLQIAATIESAYIEGMMSVSKMNGMGYMHLDFKADNVMVKFGSGNQVEKVVPIDFGASQRFDKKTGLRRHMIFDELRSLRPVRQFDAAYDMTVYSWIEFYMMMAATEGTVIMTKLRNYFSSPTGVEVRRKFAYPHGWWGQIKDYMEEQVDPAYFPPEAYTKKMEWMSEVSQPQQSLAWRAFFSSDREKEIDIFIDQWRLQTFYKMWPISDHLMEVFRRMGIMHLQELIAALIARDSIQTLFLDWLVKEKYLTNVMNDYVNEKMFIRSKMNKKTLKNIGDEVRGAEATLSMKREVWEFSVILCVIVSRMGAQPLIPDSLLA